MPRLITYNNQTYTLSEWATKLNLTPQGLHTRLKAMPLDLAMTKPVQQSMVTYPPGTAFNSWTVIEESPRDNNNDRRMLVRCECGTTRSVLLTALVRGVSKHCGCQTNRVVNAGAVIDPWTRYGKWTVISEVSHADGNPRPKKWHRRFECVCDCGHEQSVRYDYLFSGASQGCKNCADRKSIEYVRMPDGHMHKLTDLAAMFNISYPTLRARVKDGWPIERALTTPVGKNGRKDGNV